VSYPQTQADRRNLLRGEGGDIVRPLPKAWTRGGAPGGVQFGGSVPERESYLITAAIPVVGDMQGAVHAADEMDH